MGLFSSQNTSTADLMKNFGKHVAWKELGYFLGWIGVYFLTQLFASGVLMLLNLLVGILAGLIIGWTVAEDSVDETGLVGLPLWSLLTFLAATPILIVEISFRLITGWQLDMGRWMCIGVAIIMAMASAVWRASADE